MLEAKKQREIRIAEANAKAKHEAAEQRRLDKIAFKEKMGMV